MPTYEYECERCKETFEVEQKMSDPPLTVCRLPIPGRVRVCGGTVKRLISRSTTFVLKGSGWFKDGY
jgi:putative FmdB family regulatory protein